jgi:hypothetical protein
MVTLWLFEKGVILLYISILSKASAEIPPLPLFEKGDGGGI